MSNARKVLVNGTLVVAIAKYTGLFIQLFISAILARLIPASDFGIIAIATVIIAFIEILSNFGITPAIVQNKTLDKNDLSNIFSFTVYGALIGAIIFFFASWGIADFYNSDILVPICQILSIKIFFSTLNFVPYALLLKQMKFKFISICTFSLQVVLGTFAVLAAYKGYGIYSLLISPVLTSSTLFIIYFLRDPLKFKFRFEKSSIKKIFSFSVFQFLSNTLNFFSRNLDKLIIGKFLGMEQLGYYEKSYRLMLLPVQNITHVISPVMLPVFSEFQTDVKRLSSRYLEVIKLLAYIGFPLSVFLVFNSRELIMIVYGDKWVDAIPVFTILSLSVGFQIILSSSGSIFQAANATKSMFFREVFTVCVVVCSLLLTILVFGTIEVVALGYVIAVIINFVQCFWVLTNIIKLKFWTFLKVLILPIILATLLIISFGVIDTIVSQEKIFVSLSIDVALLLILAIGFVQIVKAYDVIGFTKNKINAVLLKMRKSNKV